MILATIVVGSSLQISAMEIPNPENKAQKPQLTLKEKAEARYVLSKQWLSDVGTISKNTASVLGSEARQWMSDFGTASKEIVKSVGPDLYTGNAKWVKETANRMKRLRKRARNLATTITEGGSSFGKKATQKLIVAPYGKVTGALNAAYSYAEEKTRSPKRAYYVDKPLNYVKDVSIETLNSWKDIASDVKKQTMQNPAIQATQNFIADHNPFAKKEKMDLDHFFDNAELNEQRRLDLIEHHRRENIRQARQAQREEVANNAHNYENLDQIFEVQNFEVELDPFANMNVEEVFTDPQPKPAQKPAHQPENPADKPALFNRLMTNPLTYVTAAVALPVMLAITRMAQLVNKPAAISETIKKLDALIDYATDKTQQIQLSNLDELAIIHAASYAKMKEAIEKNNMAEFVKCAKEYKKELTTLLAPATSMLSKEAVMKVFKKIQYGVKADYAAVKKWIANKVSCAKVDTIETQRA